MNFIKEDVKFGTRHTQHDNSIKIIHLSTEQIERLRNGEKYENVVTGKEEVTIEPYVRRDITVWKTPLSKIDLTFIQYQKMRLEMNDKAIMRELNISSTTLTKFKRKWGLID